MDEDSIISIGDITISNVKCVKCGANTGIGYVTFGNEYSMCNDCANKFQNWMYSKLVKEWLTVDGECKE